MAISPDSLLNNFRSQGCQNGLQLHHEIELQGFKEFKQFAKSIRRDASAVKAGIELPWSNGMVEGKVNKLKLIRCMAELVSTC